MTGEPERHPSRDADVGRFGRWADTYDESVMQRILFSPLQRAVVDLAARDVPAPGSVLDIGCGTGQLLRRVAHRFADAELVGVDASEDMVRVARAALPEGAPVRFVHAFAEDLPFGDGSFDIVVTTMSFHHWADQARALREVRRVLSADGVFVLADALPAGLLRWAFTHRQHGSFNTPAVLERMLAQAGLRVERIERMGRFGGTIQLFAARPDRR